MKTTLSLVAVLAAAASACKCVNFLDNNSNNLDLTIKCCWKMNSSARGDDCPARTIDKRMSDFDSCCWHQSQGISFSDCHVPGRLYPSGRPHH